MSSITTKEIQDMKDIFKKLVHNWSIVSDGIHQTIPVLATVDSTTRDDDEHNLMNILNNYETEYLYSIKKLFRIDLGADCIFNDDWFWAEWEPTDTCFYFVLGLTAESREKFMHGGNNEQD